MIRDIIGWIFWLIGHAWLVGAFALYIATMAARVPFKWPVIAPVIAVMAFMGAGQVYYQNGYDEAERITQAQHEKDIAAAVRKEREAANLKIALQVQANNTLQDELSKIATDLAKANEVDDSEGEAAAKTIVEALAREKAKWEAENPANPDAAEIVAESPIQNQCTKDKPNEQISCPICRKCKPSLLQRIHPSFVRPN